MVSVRASDQIGRVVGGRYRLVALLGTGASAQVYLADDVTLHRQVAVKMLQPALARDRAFLDRFEAEARAVAAVNHPNIVVVHDRDVDEVPYLVTEYLAGGSLRGMLQAGRLLTPAQALVVGLDASRALAHAHARGIVHRDLKPANLLFGEDGRLRVADFGLARALAEHGTTDHDGALVGTMRYAAPEQASGDGSGPASDVYALALVLVEAVTGQVPFAAPDPIAALQARTRGDLEIPADLGPLRAAVERAGRLDPEARADAEEFGIALLAASERMAPPDPLPLVGAEAEARSGEIPGERTVLVPVTPPGGPAGDATVANAVGPNPGHAAGPGPTPVGAAPGGAGTGAAGDAASIRGRRRWPWLVAVLAVVALVVGAVTFGPDLLAQDPQVPELVGRSIDEMALVADQNAWIIDEKKTRVDGTEPGEIVSTDPAAGDRLAEGGTLIVLVSEGNELTDRPEELVGRPLAEVALELERASLEVSSTEVFDEEVAAGLVIGTDGDVDRALPKGSVVPLLVSRGPAPRTIPDFDLPDADDASAQTPTYDTVAGALRDLSLVPVRVDVFDEEVPAGVVLAVEPGAGAEVPRDSEVRVTVSKGPDVVVVPSLGGMTLDEAEAALVRAGLVLGQDCCSSRGSRRGLRSRGRYHGAAWQRRQRVPGPLRPVPAVTRAR